MAYATAAASAEPLPTGIPEAAGNAPDKLLQPAFQVVKKTLGIAVPLLLIFGVAVLASRSRMARFSNLQVPEGTFREAYVQMKVGSAEKCLVSDRAGTTEKRSEDALAKTSWKCRFVKGVAGGPPTLIAVAKKQPSFLFVPFTAITDLAYPLLYETVRSAEDLELPRLRWVHLMFNRQFQGLYLRIRLPGRRFAEKRELGRLELLTVSGDEMVCFDRKMRPVCPVFAAAVADGTFHRPRRNAAVSFLREISPQSSRSFILSDLNHETIEPFPIPVALGELIATAQAPYRDRRYHQWQEPAATPSESAGKYAALLRDADPTVATYVADLERSIAASCVVMSCNSESAVETLHQGATLQWLARQGLGP